MSFKKKEQSNKARRILKLESNRNKKDQLIINKAKRKCLNSRKEMK